MIGKPALAFATGASGQSDCTSSIENILADFNVRLIHPAPMADREPTQRETDLAESSGRLAEAARFQILPGKAKTK